MPSEINHTPKKISNSVEEEVEIQKGKIQLVTKVKCLNSFSFSFLVVEIIVTWELEEMYFGEANFSKILKSKLRDIAALPMTVDNCVCRGVSEEILVPLGQLFHDIHTF